MPGFFTRGGGRRNRPPTRIEEVFYPAVLADPNVDADELTALLRDPSPLQVDEPAEAFDPAPRPPERAAIRVAKLAGLVSAVALLCAAIVAAAFLDRQRHETPPPEVDKGHITGVRALAGVAPGTAVTAVPAPAAQGPGGSASSQGAIWHPSGELAASPTEVAGAFYRNIAREPANALAMLGGELSDDERQELALAWRAVDRVEVHELRVRPDGLVHAIVTVTTGTDQRYRLDHLLRVAAPKITEVRLRSAQRVPAATP